MELAGTAQPGDAESSGSWTSAAYAGAERLPSAATALTGLAARPTVPGPAGSVGGTTRRSEIGLRPVPRARPAVPARSAAERIPELATQSGPTGSTGRRKWWRVSCRDIGNRQRFLTVIADRGTVVLVGPPGETAVLSVLQLDQLRTTLRQAAVQAGR